MNLLLVLVYRYLRVAQIGLQLVSGRKHLIQLELALLYLLFLLSVGLDCLLQLDLLCAETLSEGIDLFLLVRLNILEFLIFL